MPYYTGSAANMSQVRDAIVSACRTAGWVWADETLTKDGVSFRLALNAAHLEIKGVGTGGDAPGQAYVGPLGEYVTAAPMVWPVTYHLFVHPREVYCIIRYGVDVHQWLAFGKSSLAGLSGHGGWFGASIADKLIYNGIAGNFEGYYAGSAHSRWFSPVLFFCTGADAVMATAYIHDGFSGGWSWSRFDGQATTPLLALQPSEWTSESALIPIRSYVARPENKISLAAELEHARHISIANLAPGQIITLGSDRWMCFPWYRKSSAPIQSSGYFPWDTTGPLGWAIRYDGP